MIPRPIRRTLDAVLLPAAGLAMVGASFMALVYAPTEAVMGDVQRIFYFHVASAWLAMTAFAVAAAASLALLLRQRPRLDHLALASIEIGLLFTTVVLVTGPLWARPVWGAWWTWDPRLTASLILWVMFLAYLALRAALPEGRRRLQICAVYAIVAFLDVPVVFFSIRWWRSMHPQVISGRGLGLEPEMRWTLLVSCLAFSLLYLALLRSRLRLAAAEETLTAIRRRRIDEDWS